MMYWSTYRASTTRGIMLSFQRRDRIQRFSVFRQSPVLLKFCFVQTVPLEDVSQCPSGKFAGHDTGVNSNGDFKLPLLCVKMGWYVVLVKHCNDNSQESADFRHGTRIIPYPQPPNNAMRLTVLGAVESTPVRARFKMLPTLIHDIQFVRCSFRLSAPQLIAGR